MITENELFINANNENDIDAQNVANFIMLSNNFAPENIKSGNKRYLTISTSSKHKGNHQ